MMKTKYLFLLFALNIFCFNICFSQEDKTELETQKITIYTDYTIALQDASRIQYLPIIEDTFRVKPRFNYSIFPVVYITHFSPRLINAASLQEKPLPRLDNGLIKMGLGYFTPYLEVFYNNTYERNYSIGAYGKHHSAHNRAKNIENQKIYSGFNNNNFMVYGNRFLNNSTLSGNIDFSSNEIYYYGIDPEMTNIPRDKDEMEMQRWMLLNPKIGFNSNHIYDQKFNYEFLLDYNYLFNVTEDYHHGLKTKADLAYNNIGLLTEFIYHNGLVNSVKEQDKILFLNPYYKNYSEKWQIKLGANAFGYFTDNDSASYHLYPNITIQHNISNTIIPYVSFKGYLKNNCINSIRMLNPYIQRIPQIQATNYAQVIDFGFKGNISRNTYFNLKGNYSKINNKPFFVNDTSENFNNKFILEYDDIERFNGYAELSLKNIYNFDFFLSGNYYYYSYIKNNQKPWHMPNVEISFTTEYNFSNDLNFGLKTFFIGKRFAKEYDEKFDIKEKELKPIVDINLYSNYQLSSNFSCFLYLNNILGQKQYIWNNYHSFGFNFLVGLKYSF